MCRKVPELHPLKTEMSIEKLIHWIVYANSWLPRQAENFGWGHMNTVYLPFLLRYLNARDGKYIDIQNIAHEFYFDQKLIYCYYQKISKKFVLSSWRFLNSFFAEKSQANVEFSNFCVGVGNFGEMLCENIYQILTKFCSSWYSNCV